MTGVPAPASRASPAGTAATGYSPEAGCQCIALFENLAGGATVEEFMDWFAPVDEQKVRAVFQHVAESLRALGANPPQ